MTDARPGAVTLADLAGSPSRPPVVLDADQPALMTHTSGTTGVPKLVVHSARSLGLRYRWQNRAVSFIRKPATVVMHVSYVHSRMYLGLAVPQMRGMPMVFMNESAPDKVAEVLLEHRPTVLETHPNSFLEWESLADDPRRPLASVRYFNSTFDAIHPSTMHKLLHATDARHPVLLQVYGQSECGPLVARTYRRRNALKADGRCQGYATPGRTKYRLVSRDGERPSRATPGYIDVDTTGRALSDRHRRRPVRVYGRDLHRGTGADAVDRQRRGRQADHRHRRVRLRAQHRRRRGCLPRRVRAPRASTGEPVDLSCRSGPSVFV